MVHFTILRDTREQRPWEFENIDVDVQDETISTGDYTLSEFCDHDEGNDTYHPNYAVERKSGDDFLNSITRDRGRFQEEIKRASDWESPLLVIIEEPKSPSRYSDSFFLDYFDGTREQVFGTVDSWERNYNVDFLFAGNRQNAERKAYAALSTHLRGSLMSD